MPDWIVAKENKFGTFGGVYTPSLLTILGVIMYLRLPWVVGHAGLLPVLGIILVAHVISVATGLSISSIATDKNVGAGGPYYIVSRSLGLPIGGALGLALFIGLCASTSLYVIGFSESVLSTLGVEATPTTIRITGSIVLVVITAVTIISTAFAIKTQYVVFALIGVSLVAIFLGDPTQAKAVEVTEEAPSMALLFGIFFPAVTGFTAGVNMSGDLKDPKRAIPRGTMLAIATGLLVYSGLAIFLALRVDRGALISDQTVLESIAINPWLVTLGIWGATFSSGLGSIMGAPRILQALSVDRITPALFARGTGPTKEPRNALVLSFMIAEAGILIAELNAIARIVSMVFLTMYAFLNISCAIEAKVSPDFRPAFRIPASVSVVGALTCVVIMIQLDLIAMLGATAMMVGLFVYLQRKQLKLESGDAWEGVWSSLIRTALFRVTGAEEKQQRNWRPNILAFRTSSTDVEPYESLAHALITGNGILTDFEIKKDFWGGNRRPSIPARPPTPRRAEEAPEPPPEGKAKVDPAKTGKKRKKDRRPTTVDEERALGMFRRHLSVRGSAFEEIQTVCQHYGFSGLEPNALLLPWQLSLENSVEFADTIDLAADQNFNVLCYHHGSPGEKENRIYIWWRAEAGNVAFCIALLRFLTRSAEWESTKLRFLLLSRDTANNDNLRSTMRRVLREGRVEASVKVVSDSFGERSFVDRVRSLSEDAALTIVGLPNHSGDLDGGVLEELDAICEHLDRVLFVRGSSFFAEVLPTGRSAAISELPPVPTEGGSPEQLPELTISEVPDIATATTQYSEAYQQLTGRLSEQCLKKLYGRHVELIRSLKAAAERHLTVDRATKLNNPKRMRTAFNRQQSSFLLECKSLLERFAQEDLPDLRSILEGGIDAFLHDDRVVADDGSVLVISRPKADFKPAKDDPPAVRRFKSRRRFGAWLARRDPQYKVPITQLQRFYFQRAVGDLLTPAIHGFVGDSHQMLVQIGKLLNSSRVDLADEGQDVELADLFKAQREQLTRHLEDLDHRGKQLLRRRNWTLIVGALELTQQYANDIGGFDFKRIIRKERVPRPRLDTEELEQAPEQWKTHQEQLCVRARLALSLSGVQHRLTAIVSRDREAIEIGLKNGAQRECERVVAELQKLAQLLPQGPGHAASLNLHVDLKNHFDPGPILENLVQESSGSADDLPGTLDTLSDDSIQALEEGRVEAVEHVQIPVRRLMQFLTETELVGGIQEALASTPKEEQRALGIAQDVVRLVNFQLSELEVAEDIDPSDFAGQMRPVVENGMERLKAEKRRLAERTPGILDTIDRKLHLVIDGTNAYELSTASARLDQHIRVYHGRLAVSGARGYLRRALGKVRDAAVHLIYRRSEGVLLASKRRTALRSSERAVDRIASLVRSEVPAPEVTAELPFYYRQLFFGQSGVNETFWVGRKEQLAKAKVALHEFDAGHGGSLLVVGDRLSGKSALLQKLSTDLFDRRKIFRIHAPPGGATDLRTFERALKKSLGTEADGQTESGIQATIGALPTGSVIVIDDLNLWWERSLPGMAVVEEISRAIFNHGSRVLFVVAIETQAFRLINRIQPLSDAALAILECTPLPAEALKSIVILRHGSTGLKFRLGNKDEDSLGELALARLFSSHFDHTGGSVGATLRSWVANIRKVKGDSLEIGPPTRRDWEAIDTLRDNWVAILLQISLHKQLSIERLRRISGVGAAQLKDDVDALLRMGLVRESQRRVLEIEPAIIPALHERLMRRGVFA